MASRAASSSRAKSTEVPIERAKDAQSVSRDPFAALGLHGLSRLAPVILGALVTGEPLLLIGPHGTAKSLLLTRIAAALGLSCRHYNASLLNFDDLVGFPLSDGEKGLRYVTTPSAIWGAGAVIFDEISRCRPDIQNKLFPIIHERRAQGLAIEGLVYRWAAMNPPSGHDNEETDYRGSEPLDPALRLLWFPGDRTPRVLPIEAGNGRTVRTAGLESLLDLSLARSGQGFGNMPDLVSLARWGMFSDSSFPSETFQQI